MQVSPLGEMRKKVKESPDRLDDFQRRGTGEPLASIWNAVSPLFRDVMSLKSILPYPVLDE